MQLQQVCQVPARRRRVKRRPFFLQTGRTPSSAHTDDFTSASPAGASFLTAKLPVYCIYRVATGTSQRENSTVARTVHQTGTPDVSGVLHATITCYGILSVLLFTVYNPVNIPCEYRQRRILKYNQP